MASRYPLPVAPPAPANTIDSVRDRLGGRGESLPGVGALVRIPSGGGTTRPGVVLFASEDRFDVWIGSRQVRRVLRSDVEPCDEPPTDEMLVVSSDARVFSQLQEGTHVRFNPAAIRHDEGTIAEKCRYGALVRRADGSLVGVGFQKLWPVGDGTAN
jgi:hypothetical protein